MSPRSNSCIAESSSVRSLSSDEVSTSKSIKKKSRWARATDPAHRRGRRIQLLQMLVLPFIPILALIVQTANTLHDILIYRQEVSDIEAQDKDRVNKRNLYRSRVFKKKKEIIVPRPFGLIVLSDENFYNIISFNSRSINDRECV
ncbi:hypothetical protein PV325_002198, partial [Microctonus aethiopoides]